MPLRRLLASLAACTLAAPAAAQSTSPLAGPGGSLALARERAATLRDVRYALGLDLTARDSAVGTVTVRVVRTGKRDLLLDWRGRRLVALTVNGREAPTSLANGAHIVIPARLLVTGENTVTARFVTDIAPTGASIIRSHDPDGSDYLYTLLVPADANQLFPCFDQPDLKARVTTTLTTPRAWLAVANGSERAADTTATAITHHFTETRPLSTYLIAFAAGPWARVASTVNGRTVALYVRTSRRAEADADTLLAFSHRALAWMEQYFARPYPFEKFDMVLAPAFPFGGMEHPGVIMYNENSFIFRERPTLQRRIGRQATILHETAHQWFGDLVTMRWFDDLWLKEGFATYMAAKAQVTLDSTSGAWKTFYQQNKPAAYGVDQTRGTTPLWQELGNLDQAKSNYGPIVYNKAPSVLKQLNYLVGDDAFQRGVRAFLDRHAYANATWQQLLASIGQAAEPAAPRDAQGLTAAMRQFGANFMLRRGMPAVEQSLTVRAGRIERLVLAQRPVRDLSGPAPWPMRAQLLLWYGPESAARLPVTLTGRTTDVTAARGRPAPRFAFANADDYGYFLTYLDSASIGALEQGAIRELRDPFLRSMLWGALWDQVRDARLDPVRYARLVLREAPFERDEQLLPQLLGRLARATTVYARDDAREPLRVDAERVTWALASDASRPFGIRRAAADAFIGMAATADGVATLERLLTADSLAGEPLRDPTRWDVVNRLLVLGAPTAERALAAQAARDTTPDGRRRAFTAGAARGDSATKRAYFTRYFSDRTLNEDWASGSLVAFNAAEHAAQTLPYLRAALDSLPYIQANRRIFFLGSWLGAFVGGQHSEAALAIVHRYLADHPALPRDLAYKVLQASDDLERTVRIRARNVAIP
ncbi:MAG: ERAP1-like C-terminal domain-containing protein [Gemmatimonadetes bacterium]|nr:ERAP1-like C-terminal domain-containing protein [Gemmatimonadota bacterium]